MASSISSTEPTQGLSASKSGCSFSVAGALNAMPAVNSANAGRTVPIKDPTGRTYYWFTVVPVEATEEGTDRWAIEQGYVSLMPLTLDLTDHAALSRVQQLDAWKQLKFA